MLQGLNNSIGAGPQSPPMKISADLGSIMSESGGMFDEFVRHALSCCVDYDSSRLDLDVKDFEILPPSNTIATDDLPSNMEDNFVELNLSSYPKDLLSAAQSRHVIFRDDFVVKAFNEAEKAHRGRKRASGQSYLEHCLETAVLLANIGANSTVVAAGLLHDTVDGSGVTYADISMSLGTEVADLVEGVSKLSQLSKLAVARDNNTANKTVEAERLQTMFLAMADARAVLIKVADRLNSMLTLDALPLSKQQRFSKKTLEVFASLANRLGVSTWKVWLENLCFKHLNPDHHQELAFKLMRSFDESIIMLTSSLNKLEKSLQTKEIFYHMLSSRHKSLYSIYSKMLKKKLSMDEIHDIHGFRLIVETEEDCYKALKVVHQLWPEVHVRFKDYINCPKFNGYQSLHTVAIGDDMIPLKIQIRTKEMHRQAEFGIAAHWRYNEGKGKHASFVLQMVEWARWLITWQCEAMTKGRSPDGLVYSMKPPCTFPNHSKDCTYSCKPLYDSDGSIFVILIDNDKMSVQEIPANSSVMNLLEIAGRGSSRWISYGLPASDPTCELKMGDAVQLTPAIPDKSLTEYREEIERMYDRGLTISSAVESLSINSRSGFRS